MCIEIHTCYIYIDMHTFLDASTFIFIFWFCAERVELRVFNEQVIAVDSSYEKKISQFIGIYLATSQCITASAFC